MQSTKHTARPMVAVLEDEAAMRVLLRRMLESEFDLRFVDGRHDLLECLAREPVSIVLLDIMLPGEDGIAIASAIKDTSNVPVILVSGLSSAETIARGLNIGADDYVTKPFDVRVLTARMHRALRQARRPAEAPADALLEFDDCTANPLTRIVRGRSGAETQLTEREFRLLAGLAKTPFQVVDRDTLSCTLTGMNWSPLNRGLDVHVSNLRRKLRQATGRREVIASSRGVGYTLQLKPAAKP